MITIIHGDDIIAVNKNVYGDRIAPKKPRILKHITVDCLYNSHASKSDLYDWGLRLKAYVKPCDITAICPEPFFYDEGDKKALESREVYCTQFFVPRYNGLYIEDKKLKYEAPPKISKEEAKEKYLKSKDLIITLE